MRIVPVEVRGPVNRAELRRYVERVSDRWPIDGALLGGAQLADERGAPPQRERGPEYVVVLISEAFDGMPWLERVYHAGALWDAMEMGAPAEVHCYTAAEFARKRDALPRLRRALSASLDLLAVPA